MAEESRGFLATRKAKLLLGGMLLVVILAGYFLAGVFPLADDRLNRLMGGRIKHHEQSGIGLENIDCFVSHHAKNLIEVGLSIQNDCKIQQGRNIRV